MIYLFGEYVLDTARRELTCEESPVKLERKAYQVLVYLIEQRERLVTKDELLEHIWPDTYVNDSAVARCIRDIRRALGERRDASQVIQTRYGHGYRFVAEVITHAAVAPQPPSTPNTAIAATACGPFMTPPMFSAVPIAKDLPLSAPRACHACAHLNPLAAHFCMVCGTILETACETPAAVPPPASGMDRPVGRKLVTVLVCALPATLTEGQELDNLQDALDTICTLIRQTV
ncbi:MAG: hypothetical protein ETSY2_43240 [Candidatus Entotheonella gemina]|uniref:OmpR/PhoB-type domain-containing protein n=1 Tax=Candidatus Entotheonella gemina TaxID=1429439 RepID=W4LJ59_9BACT|nr:MAG: hypothetical protein ETSY2_43240 [Candidatus Entotheonella gemina]